MIWYHRLGNIMFKLNVYSLSLLPFIFQFIFVLMDLSLISDQSFSSLHPIQVFSCFIPFLIISSPFLLWIITWDRKSTEILSNNSSKRWNVAGLSVIPLPDSAPSVKRWRIVIHRWPIDQKWVYEQFQILFLFQNVSLQHLWVLFI